MQDLKVSLIQTELHWEDPVANMAHFEELIWRIDQDNDVILLPEMFTTGFTMQVKELAEPMNLHAFKWMQSMAAQTKSAICGSIIIKEEGHFFNRLIWMNPDGSYHQYDKRHLFTFADEDKHFSPGNKKLILEFKGWKICPLICYDLRFPVWSRNDSSNPYDLLLYVANWPTPRISAWTSLLSARAVENASYCVGLNRIGEDGKGLKYNGQSAAYDHLGHAQLQANEADGIFTVSLNAEKLKSYRQKFPVLLDQDKFDIL